MSWSITVNDLNAFTELPDEIFDKATDGEPEECRNDAIIAFQLAKRTALVSATLSGGRTPSPYGGPDSVVISVVGFSDHRVGKAVPPAQFNEMMREVILHGPDRFGDDGYDADAEEETAFWTAPYENQPRHD